MKHMIGKYWSNIPGYEDRVPCTTYNTTESMAHIMTQCSAPPNRTIWSLAKDFWPHENIPWPEINLGIILSCGCINMQHNDEREINQHNRSNTHQGPSRLLQILLSESAYLIWVLRCGRVIHEKQHTENEEIKGSPALW